MSQKAAPVIDPLEAASSMLARQDAMHRRILDTANVAIFLVDQSGRITQANQGMAEMFGVSVEALQGSDYVLLIHPSEREAGQTRMQSLLTNAVASVDVDRLYWRADESVFWGCLSSKHFLDASGASLGLIGSIVDITQRKTMEESLEESQEKYRGLSEAAFEAIFISEKGQCLEQNRRAQYMFGYTDEEALGRLGTQWIAAPDRDRVMHNMQTGYELPYEVTGLRKDGSTFPAVIRGKMMHYKGRTVRVTSMSDITERKLAEEALRRSETKFRTLYDSSDDAVLMLDENGFLGCNKAALELFGCSSQEDFCAHRPGDYSPPQQPCGTDSAVLAAHHRAVAMARGSNRFEWLHQRDDTGEPFTAEVLLSAMTLDGKSVLQATVRNISARKAAEDKIKSLAFYDPLTHLPNRRLLLDRLEQALSAGARHQRQGALLFIDLDNFKTLNDTLGHGIGDLLLQQAAQRLVGCIREADTVARLGGDEFVVMLEDLSENAQEAATQAEAVGLKILACLSQPYQLSEHAQRSSASIGISLFNAHQESVDELMRRADLAMYQAKSAGRNALRFFDPQMQALITSRAAMEAALGVALQKNQFVLYYQAQVVGERLLTGVEVLVRWRHPLRGLVPPGEFIPLAEETGLILPLGHWVLETACAQLARWATRPEMAHLTVAVNVSSLQFRSPDFVTEVLSILEHTGANPQRLKLELTESLMVSDVEDIITKMSSLKARGVGFSLDDFGTGYSSLSYLKRLPLTQLKIDQGFVRDILLDPNDAAIAKMVVALADSMGLAVIAEGVETEAQRDFLARQGCSAYQGYLFSRPVPLEEFEALVGRV